MVNLRAKGKIPRSEWPRISSKYAGGESVAQIGRDYGCTAPAIRYIIKRVGMLKGNGDGPPSGHKILPSPISRTPNSRSTSLSRQRNTPPHVATGSGTLASWLGPELRARVTGDVVSILAALDRAVIESSIESLTALREAVDNLMRSAARTHIELGRMLNGGEAADPGQSRPALEKRHRPA